MANVIDSDPDDYWLVVEKAYKITPIEFTRLMGTDIKNFMYYVRSRTEYNLRSIFTVKDKEKLDNNEFVQELLDMMVNFNMLGGDFGRISSWGKVRDRLVLIDYGLTKDIFDQYYTK